MNALIREIESLLKKPVVKEVFATHGEEKIAEGFPEARICVNVY